MNHLEEHLMLSLRSVVFRALSMTDEFEYLLFLIKKQNGEFDVRNFRWFLFGVSPNIPEFKSAFYK